MPSSRLDELLTESVDGQDLFEPGVEVGLTLREQAELAQYRKLVRALRTLRDDAIVPSEGVVDEILAYLEDATERHAIRSILSGRRGAYLGGIAAATAAGAAGAIVLVNRSRRRLPLAG